MRDTVALDPAEDMLVDEVPSLDRCLHGRAARSHPRCLLGQFLGNFRSRRCLRNLVRSLHALACLGRQLLPARHSAGEQQTGDCSKRVDHLPWTLLSIISMTASNALFALTVYFHDVETPLCVCRQKPGWRSGAHRDGNAVA